MPDSRNATTPAPDTTTPPPNDARTPVKSRRSTYRRKHPEPSANPDDLMTAARQRADRCLAFGDPNDCDDKLSVLRARNWLWRTEQQGEPAENTDCARLQLSDAHVRHDRRHLRQILSERADKRFRSDYELAFNEGAKHAFRLMCNALAAQPDRLDQVREWITKHREQSGSQYDERQAADWLHWDRLMHG